MTQLGLEFVRSYATPAAVAALTFEEIKHFAAFRRFSASREPVRFAAVVYVLLRRVLVFFDRQLTQLNFDDCVFAER